MKSASSTDRLHNCPWDSVAGAVPLLQGIFQTPKNMARKHLMMVDPYYGATSTHKILQPNSKKKHRKIWFPAYSLMYVLACPQPSFFLPTDKVLAKDYDPIHFFRLFHSQHNHHHNHTLSSPNARCQSGKSLLRGRRHTGRKGHEFSISRSNISGQSHLSHFMFHLYLVGGMVCFET